MVDSSNSYTSEDSAIRWWQAWAGVLIATTWNLWVTRAELTTVARPNDTSVHEAMVGWASARISRGDSPFDGWFPDLALGLPQFHHYQSLPHIIAAYAGALFHTDRIVDISAWLLWGTWPVAVYMGARLLGLGKSAALAAAILSPLVSNVDFYGFEMGSYMWRGNGLWSQAWGMWCLPIAFGLGTRYIQTGSGVAPAVGAVALVGALHFISGYLLGFALVAVTLFLGSRMAPRIRRLLVLGACAICVDLWMLVPLFQDRAFSTWTEFNVGSVFTDSIGAREALWRLVSGAMFDSGRLPVVTALLAFGVIFSVVAPRNPLQRAIPLLFVATLMFYFGRPTWGPLIDFIPGTSDIVLHRILGLVHLLGVLLAGLGAAGIVRFLADGAFRRLRPYCAGRRPTSRFLAVGVAALTAAVLFPAVSERARFAGLDGTWIAQQVRAERVDLPDLERLEPPILLNHDGRVWAGSPGIGVEGQPFLIGRVPIYMYLLYDRIDQVGFYLRTVSLNSDPETQFDPRNPGHFDLFNVRYAILPLEAAPPRPDATQIAVQGRFKLWQIPTLGYLSGGHLVLPPISASRRQMLSSMRSFLQTAPFDATQIKPVRFEGSANETPSDVTDGALPDFPVVNQRADLDDGRISAIVQAPRPGYALARVTYHPRWELEIDGQSSPYFMAAPAVVAFRVPEGQHQVDLTYRPVPDRLLLLVLGLTLAATLAYLNRRWELRRAGDLAVSTDGGS